MTTQNIATRLVDLCRNGKIEEAKEELFAQDIISIEPYEGLLPKENQRHECDQEKAELFASKVENFFGSTISEPICCRRLFFACELITGK